MSTQEVKPEAAAPEQVEAQPEAVEEQQQTGRYPFVWLCFS